jgi:hypothetical protein
MTAISADPQLLMKFRIMPMELHDFYCLLESDTPAQKLIPDYGWTL